MISCANHDNAINRTILREYNFQFSNLSELENRHSVLNDTIIYSFINADSITGNRYKYQELTVGSTVF